MTDYAYMVLLREQLLYITGSDEPQESVPQIKSSKVSLWPVYLVINEFSQTEKNKS